MIGTALGRIRIFDRNLNRSYNAIARTEALRRFLLAGKANRIDIVVHDPGRIRAECPRLVALQRHFAHAISIHRTQSPARSGPRWTPDQAGSAAASALTTAPPGTPRRRRRS